MAYARTSICALAKDSLGCSTVLTALYLPRSWLRWVGPGPASPAGRAAHNTLGGSAHTVASVSARVATPPGTASAPLEIWSRCRGARTTRREVRSPTHARRSPQPEACSEPGVDGESFITKPPRCCLVPPPSILRHTS